MPTTYYNAHWREPGTGALIAADVALELDFTITGDAEIRVDAVRTTNSRGEANADLLASKDPGVRAFAVNVKAAAEGDVDFCRELIAEAAAAARENADCDRYHQRRDDALCGWGAA